MNQEIKKERKVVRKDVILLCAIVFLAFIVVCAISVFNSSKASAINKVDDTFSSINKVEEVVDIPNEKIGNQSAIEENVEDANIDDSEINDSEKDNTEIDSSLDSSEDCLSCPPENVVFKEYTIEIGSDMDVTDVLTEDEIAASNGNWSGNLYGPSYTSLSGSYYSNERSNSTSFSASASASNSGRWGTISCSCSCYIRVYVYLPSSGILRTVINNGGQLRVRSTFSGQWGGSYWGTGDDYVGSSWGGRTLGGDASASSSKWTAIVKVSVSCSCSLGGSAYVYWSLTGNSSHGVGSISWSNTGGNVWANNRTATVTVSDTVDGVYQVYSYVVNSSGSSVQSSQVLSGNLALSSSRTHTTNTTYGSITVYYVEWARGRTQSQYRGSGSGAMMVDNGKPSVSGSFNGINVDTTFMNASNKTSITFNYSVSDGGGHGTASGVNKIRIWNNTVSALDATFNITATTSSSSTYSISIGSNTGKVNGVYYIRCWDQAGNQSSDYQIGTLKLYDINAPTFGSVSYAIQSAGTAVDLNSGTDTTVQNITYGSTVASGVSYGKNTFTNAPLKVTVTVSDTTGQSAGTAYNAPSIGSVALSYYYCGKLFTTTITESGTQCWTSGSGYHYSSSSGGYNSNATLTRTYVFYLGFSPNAIYLSTSSYESSNLGFKVTIKDGSGQTTTRNVSTNGYDGTKSNVLIDNIAPEITSVSVSNGGSATSYSYNDASITINVKDYGTTESTSTMYYYKNSSYRYSNGSGVKYLYICTNSALTSRLSKADFDKYFEITTANVTEEDSGGIRLNLTKLIKSTIGEAQAIVIKQKCDSCIYQNLYFYAEDYVGNIGYKSGNYTGTLVLQGTTFTYDTNTAGTGNCGAAGYYLYPSSAKAVASGKYSTVYRDTFMPQVYVLNGSGQVIASTNGYKTNYNNGCSLSKNFTFQWTTGTTAVSVVYLFGCSGKEYVKAGASPTTISLPTATNSVTLTGTTSATQYGSVSTTGATSYSKTYVISGQTYTYSDLGESTKKFSVSSKNGKSSEVSITFRRDTTAPDIEMQSLLCVRNGDPTSSSNLVYSIDKSQFGNILNNSQNNYFYAGEQGVTYWLKFKLTDNLSGICLTNNNNIRYYGVSGNGQNNTNSSNGAYDYTEKYNGSTLNSESKKGVATLLNNDVKSGEFYIKVFSNPTNITPVSGVTHKYTITVRDWLGNSKVVNPNSLDSSNQSSSTEFTFKADPFKVGIETKTVRIYYFNDANMYNEIMAGKDIRSYASTKYSEYTDLKYWAHNRDGWKNGYFVVREEYKPNIAGSNGYLYYDSLSPLYSLNDLHTLAKNVYTGYESNNPNLPSTGYKNAIPVTTNATPMVSGYKINQYVFEKASGVYQFAIYEGPKALIDKDAKKYALKQSSTENGLVYDYKVSTNYDVDPSTLDAYRTQVTSAVSGTTISSISGYPCYFVIKQDNDAPVVKSIYYTWKENATSHDKSDALYAFNLTNNNGTYSILYDSEHSKGKDYIIDSSNYSGNYSKINNAYYNVFWTTKTDLVLCVEVTDTKGTTHGSGANVLTLTEKRGSSSNGSKELTLSVDTTNQLYYFKYTNELNKPLNYATSLVDLNNKTFDMTLSDHAGNSVSITSMFACSNDSPKKYSMFPVLDNQAPTISVAEVSYNALSKKALGYDGTSYQYFINKDLKAKGQISVSFNMSYGISGAKVYIRKYGTVQQDVFGRYDANNEYYLIPDDKRTVEYPSSSGEVLYYYTSGKEYSWDIIKQKWGALNNQDFTIGSTVCSNYPESTNTSAVSASTNVNYTLTSSNEYYDILIVGNNGKYYLAHIGKIFIDTEPPRFINSMTFFTAVSSYDDEATDVSYAYSDLQTIWGNTVTNNIYTNAEVNVYAYVEDSASGVKTVKTGIEENATVLTKVSITGVPVLVVSATNELYAYYYGQSYNTTTYKQENRDLTYYRLKSSSATAINLAAYDNSDNYIDKNSSSAYKFTPVTLNLDNTEVTFSNNNGGADWTNTSKVISFTVTTGISQLSKFDLIEKTVKNETINRSFVLPKYSSNGAIVPTSGDTTYINNYLSISVAKAGNNYTYSFNITYSSDIDSTFEIIGYNGITEAYAKGYKDSIPYKNTKEGHGECTLTTVIPHSHSSYQVRIDKTAPVIDDDATSTNKKVNGEQYSNIPSLTSWHTIARVLKVALYDSNNGNDVVSGIDTERTILFKKSGNNYTNIGRLNKFLTITGSKDNNAGIYISMSGTTQVELDEYNTYRIQIYDLAGNEKVYEFINRIDNDNVTITNNKVYFETQSGEKIAEAQYEYKDNAYVYYMTPVGVRSPIAWANTKLFLNFDYSCNSGLYVQVYSSDSNIQGTYTYSETEQKVIKNSAVVDTTALTGNYKISLGSGSSYKGYYAFRFLSVAEYNELSSTQRVTSGTTYNINLKAWETTSQESSKSIEVNDAFKTGLVAYDIITPTLNNSTNMAFNPAYGSSTVIDNTYNGHYASDVNAIYNSDNVAGYIDTQSGWLGSDTTFSLVLNSSSKFASGAIMQYQFKNYGDEWSNLNMFYEGYIYSYTNESWVKGSSQTNDCAVTINTTTGVATMAISLRESCNNRVYRVRMVTGSGLTTNWYTFGYIDYAHNVFNGIRIDKSIATHSSLSRLTNAQLMGEMTNQQNYQTQRQSEYQAAGNNVYDTNSGKYTKYNSIVASIAISNIGYSGATTTVKDNGSIIAVFNIPYAQGQQSVSRYFAVSGDGSHIVTIETVSGAGLHPTNITLTILIDTATPYLYVKGISGTKATNWGWTDNNIGIDEAEYYYISNVTITFGVGNIAYTGGTRYINSPNSSGYQIQYSNDNGDTWNKIGSANTSVFTVRDEGNYIFRIYANPESVTLDSNTGKFKAGTNIPLCYELGKDIKNNKDEIINKASINFSALTDSPINGHVDGDNDDNSYTYIFFIDSSEYSYTYSGRVNLGNYGYDDYTENFVSIDTQMSNSSHIYSDANTVTKFHHGDKIKIIYTSKYNATNNGGDFDYLHLRTTVGMPGDSDPTIVCNSENNAALEKNGYFYLQFINNNVEIISYFYAEVAVSYSSQKVFYIQDNELDLLAPTASGQYRNQSTNELIYLSFDYKYYKYNSEFNNATLVDSPSETGAYYVFTSVKSNCGDIRITKEGSTKAATNKQEFVLQYFNLTKTENSKNYYNVNNIDDFTHISDSYYVMDGSVINRTEKSYLYAENVYTLKENTNLDARQLSGDFAGEFDGNNNTITIYETELTESYGLFERISGTVHSFNLVANSIININLADKSNIGLLAEELSGTIYDISVIADLNIMKVVAGSNIGGVVAKADSGATFGDNLKYIYSDVRITNINEREVYNDATPSTGEKVNISSLVGFINSASINYVLVFGYIEMHNINTANISVGLGYGDAYENSSFVVSTFEYYGNNTYINDEYINGVTSSTTNVTYDSQPDPISYNTFVSSYENEIIGNVKIVEKHIRRLYQDFGYVYSSENLATYGNGTSANKLVIESVAQLSMISNYVNISYTINGNYNADKGVYEFDMTSFNKPIALHTIFNGSITTTDDKYVIMRGIGNYITNYEYDKFGLFGKFNGSISNIAFTDFVININQQTDRLYSGLVAAISYSNAVINNIIIIGRETVTSDIDDVATYVGSVVGFANESSINDIFTMNYISVNSDNVYVGGIVGNAESITLPKDSSEGAIYSLGTMVVNGNKNSFLGTIAGIGSIITVTGIAESVYIIKDNTYKADRAIEETIGNDNVNDYGVNIVTFDSLDMRNTSFKSINVNIFKNVVFGGIQLYPLIGEGTSANPFEINNESEFNNINIALYAEYKIKNNITFANFETIGNGLSFTGKISGSGGSEDEEPSAENSMITSLSNVTKPLVYQNKGEITDLSVNVRYTKTVKNVANFEYAPIAIINYGVIRNVKVEGNVNITAETNQTTIYTSGFVVYAKPQSSIIYDGDAEKMQNLISNLNITINGGGTVVFGGYAAELQAGDLFVFSYGLATGTVNINTPNNIHAGLLIGYAHQNYTFNLADNNPNYAYRIIENGVEKVVLDGEGKLIESTLIGKVWGE